MSLYMPSTRGSLSTEFAVAPGQRILSEGLALVFQAGAQSKGVMPSTGQATDLFAGFSIAATVGAPFTEPFYNAVVRMQVPQGGIITLDREPIAGQISVYDETAKADVDPVTVQGSEVSGLTVGNIVVITFKFLLTVEDRISLFGHQQPGGFVGEYVGQIGAIYKGSVATSEFDASVNWEKAESVKLAPNGQVTDQTGTGAEIPGCRIIAAPGTQIPFLVLFLV